MSLSWSALHAHLLHSVTRLNAERAYQAIRRLAPKDLPPGDIGELFAFLHARDGDAAAKNTALRHLVAAGAKHPHFAETSSTLVLLALWPGLDAVRGRLRRKLGAQPDLDGDLVGRLAQGIRELDLGRVDRIAATLLRNVERDVVRDLVRCARETPSPCPIEDVIDRHAEAAMFGSASLHPDDGTARLEEYLRQVVGDDAALVMAVAVHGWSQREAAAHMDIGHEAARKRYQRACARLRDVWS